jgi:microcystin-dependent protein
MDPLLGSIMLFAGNFAPRGFALCQGQLLSIAQNQALFAILGTTYGGDGVATFGLPDLRGRAPIGAGQGQGLSSIILGQIGGKENVSLTLNNLPAHNHTCVVTVKAASDGRPGSDTPAGQALDSGSGKTLYSGATPDTPMAAGMATAQLAPSGGSQPFSIRKPYLGLNYCIATQGVFPSRN